MILHVIAARYERDFVIHLKFNNGSEGLVDLSNEMHGEMFAPLQDVEKFRAFELDPELGKIRPGGRAVIGHPEGRAYVERIAQRDPFPLTPLPSKAEARQLFGTAGLRLARYVDEERLLIAVAEQEARPES